MKYYSLNHNAPNVSFQEAVIQGLASDRIVFSGIDHATCRKIFLIRSKIYPMKKCFQAIRQFVGDEIQQTKRK
jgi:threonine synthase